MNKGENNPMFGRSHPEGIKAPPKGGVHCFYKQSLPGSPGVASGRGPEARSGEKKIIILENLKKFMFILLIPPPARQHFINHLIIL